MEKENPIAAAEEAFANFAYGPETTEDSDSESQETASEAPEDEIEDSEGVDSGEEENDDTEALEASEEETAEIEIDGEILEVPARYKDYFLRQKDYTEKTQALAEERKTLEVIRGQAEQQAKEFQLAQESYDDMLKLHGLTNQIQQAKQFISQYVQSDHFSSQELERYREAVRQLEEEQDSLSGELQQRLQQAQEQASQKRQELLKKGTEVLKARIPQWGEDSARQVRDYALSNGFSEAEISTVVDPRHVEVLWKAAQYDNLKKNTGQAVKKVQSAPKVKAKSRNPMPKDVGQKLNLRKKLKNQDRPIRQKTRDVEDYIAGRFNI